MLWLTADCLAGAGERSPEPGISHVGKITERELQPTNAKAPSEERTVVADDLPLLDRAAQRNIREVLGERLRAYYGHARDIPLSEPLAQLITQLEKRLEAEARGG